MHILFATLVIFFGVYVALQLIAYAGVFGLLINGVVLAYLMVPK